MADIEDLGEILARRDFGPCSCPDCASLCHGVSGVYDPAHLNRLVESGRTTLAALAPHLVEDYYYLGGAATREAGDEAAEIVFYLRPRMSSEGGGGLAPLLPAVGSCSRLGAGGCTLARGEMPVGCVSAFACRGGGGYGKSRAPEMWGTDEGRDLVRRFEAESRRQTPGVALGRLAVLGEEKRMPAEGRAFAMVAALNRVDAHRRAVRDALALGQRDALALGQRGAPWADFFGEGSPGRGLHKRHHTQMRKPRTGLFCSRGGAGGRAACARRAARELPFWRGGPATHTPSPSLCGRAQNRVGFPPF